MNEELTNEVVTEEVTETEKTGRFYTDEEIAMIEQKAGDKRVSQAMKKAEAKNKEAMKLAQMDTQQRYEYELQQREEAIIEKERQLILAENKNVASKILSDKGISLDLVDFVLADDADTMNDNIKKLEKAFKQSVKAEVEKRIGTSTPKKNLVTDGAITKEQFNKMSLSELQQLKANEPEIYNSFIK